MSTSRLGAKRRVDSTRASRDGHEFHEAWTARKALQLFWPNSDLVGIAVEGLSPRDELAASKDAMDIADLSLYFGREPSFELGAGLTIVQFKYSIVDQDRAFRASDAKKTISKFAKAYCDYKDRYGAQSVTDRLDFQLITNRPIHVDLLQAISAIASGAVRQGEVEEQAYQFASAADLAGKSLPEFASKVSIVGRMENLQATQDQLKNLLVDWSASHEPIAYKRLGRLKDLIREKAGYAGSSQNLITRPDILAALEVRDVDDLLPCEAHLVDAGPIVERKQLSEALKLIETATEPVLIHSAGGVGKTVFMETLARHLQETCEVVFFDCFGGGAYRSLEDSRHQPMRGLIHIANTLSFRGLCDPMLPDGRDLTHLLRTFRRRLNQCVETTARVALGRRIVLLIDAVDNAEQAARERSEDAFPTILLENLSRKPIVGISIVMSCRSHRKPTSAGCTHFELSSFSLDETRTFLRARLPSVTPLEVDIAYARSLGNPRVLEYLLLGGSDGLVEAKTGNTVDLTEILQKRIEKALATALARGNSQGQIDGFLAGLAVLPPPVPVDECAEAHGLPLSEVGSFASDLAPLLERTNQGLTFRDEPTETLVRERYDSATETLKHLAVNLLARQDKSVYAARVLPGLLHKLDDGAGLFALAFDERTPASISTVGRRNIRSARLKAATLHAVLKGDHNRLTRLLVELSTIADVEQRGDRFILQNPELALASDDPDALRRLLETRSGWPGARHAGLAIVNSFHGEVSEAHRQVFAANEWLLHANRKKRRRRPGDDGPTPLDAAAIPFFHLLCGTPSNAASHLNHWYDWYDFMVCKRLFSLSGLALFRGVLSKQSFGRFTSSLNEPGQIAAVLSFCTPSRPKIRTLVAKLASRCSSKDSLLPKGNLSTRYYEIEDGLRKASALAVKLGLRKEAVQISFRTRHNRPAVWVFRRPYNWLQVFQFIFHQALVAAAKGFKLHEKDVIPSDLVPICARIRKNSKGKRFLERAKAELQKREQAYRAEGGDSTNLPIPAKETGRDANRFLDDQLLPLLELTKALSSALGAAPRKIDGKFRLLVDVWGHTRKIEDPYNPGRIDRLLDSLGLESSIAVLWSRGEIGREATRYFLEALLAREVSVFRILSVVEILATREPTQNLAGELAVRARELIQQENEVLQRSDLYAKLARAMLPASIDEASTYFKEGLEQMDAVGSGDHVLTNELLVFASTTGGDELEEHEFHTLSNLAELNLSDEPEQFNWGVYGRGLSATAGLRGLAKLSRWDDRSQVPLECTLLPYLIGLLEHEKIAPYDALALNRLAKPVEHYHYGTRQFADAVRLQAGPDPKIIKALLEQYRDDNSGAQADQVVERLRLLAQEALGNSPELIGLLNRCLPSRVTADFSNASDPDQPFDRLPRRQSIEDDRQELESKALARIIDGTKPADASSLTQAISDFRQLDRSDRFEANFFAALKAKLEFKDRGVYLSCICTHEHLSWRRKLAELGSARENWGHSSASLEGLFKELAVPLVSSHAYDLIQNGRLSGSVLKEFSDLTGVSEVELVLGLIEVFGRSHNNVPGSVWLALASYLRPSAVQSEGTLALSRLLCSKASALANKTVDGGWTPGLYPDTDRTEVLAGLVWYRLGAPDAASRWRAAHSIRDFAAYGRWEVVDALVSKLSSRGAGPFQASELPFFYMHARLWLLIALARLAMDFPERIAVHANELLSILRDTEVPHVLMRHFAAQILRGCMEEGSLALSTEAKKLVLHVNRSRFRPLSRKNEQRYDFFCGRPDGQTKPDFEFRLQYDFEKFEVDGLGRVFGESCWQVSDSITRIVQRADPTITAMSDLGGRPLRDPDDAHRMTLSSQTYGQQLGWHALSIAAGELLSSTPVSMDEYDWETDLWEIWRSRYLLTRDDGFWLSDGTDHVPLDVRLTLLEPVEGGLAVTGNDEKILSLAGLSGENLIEELVIEGGWHSIDKVRVQVSSALVQPHEATMRTQQLLNERPFFAWLPCFFGFGDGDFLRKEREGFTPWVACPEVDPVLDRHDPFGVGAANRRPRLAQHYATLCQLRREDPFGRKWLDQDGVVSLRGEAWGRYEENREADPEPGQRLWCRSSVLEKILKACDKSLLVLIKLELYERQSRRRTSHFTHSLAVVEISQSLEVKYSEGAINQIHESRF